MDIILNDCIKIKTLQNCSGWESSDLPSTWVMPAGSTQPRVRDAMEGDPVVGGRLEGLGNGFGQIGQIQLQSLPSLQSLFPEAWQVPGVWKAWGLWITFSLLPPDNIIAQRPPDHLLHPFHHTGTMRLVGMSGSMGKQNTFWDFWPKLRGSCLDHLVVWEITLQALLL